MQKLNSITIDFQQTAFQTTREEERASFVCLYKLSFFCLLAYNLTLLANGRTGK